jgi:hypothetical protein
MTHLTARAALLAWVALAATAKPFQRFGMTVDVR